MDFLETKNLVDRNNANKTDITKFIDQQEFQSSKIGIKSVYPFRRQSVFSNLNVIQQVFGIDAAQYVYYLCYIPVTLALMYICNIFLQIIIFSIDYGKQENQFNTNFVSLQSSILENAYRGITYYCSLFIFIIFTKFSGYLRIVVNKPLQYKVKIQDYSLILQNLQQSTTDEQIQQILRKNGSEQVEILNYIRIEKPKLIEIRNNINILQKQYLNRLQSKDKRIYHINCCNKCMKIFGFLQILQALGYKRNAKYYEYKINKLQCKYTQLTQNKETKDSAIITVGSKITRNLIIQKLSNQKVQGSLKLKVIKAPHPKDIIYQNISITHINRLFRMISGFIVVVIVCALCFVFISFVRFELHSIIYDKNIFKTYWSQQISYFFIYMCIVLFDLLFRPFLYMMQKFERYTSYSSGERNWMVKLYMYQLINKFSLFYSRNFLQIISVFEKKDIQFFNIFKLTKQWRRQSDTVGQDVWSFVLMEIIFYNILDIIEYPIYHIYFHSIAITELEKVQAYQSLPIRLSSRYVNLLTFLTLLFGFCSLLPELLLLSIAYFVIQNIIIRIIFFRIGGYPYQHETIAYFFEKMIFVSIIIGGLITAQSYISNGTSVYYAIGFSFSFFVMLLFVHLPYFDKFFSKFNPLLQKCINDLHNQNKEQNQSTITDVSQLQQFDDQYTNQIDYNNILENDISINKELSSLEDFRRRQEKQSKTKYSIFDKKQYKKVNQKKQKLVFEDTY